MKRIVALLLCIALTLAFVASCSEAERPLTVVELLEVAERHLLDGNYEQALVEFMRIIEVEPREPRGYTGAADALIGLGRYDEAAAILERGLGVLPDNAELSRMLEDLQPSEVAAEFESGFEIEPEPESEPELDLGFLSVLPDLLETDGFEALEEALDSGEFHELINQIETFPMIYLEDCGTRGIGIYDYGWVYIGEFDGQIRSGHGIWFNNFWGISVFRFEGEWRDDLPNGYGTVYRRDSMSTGTLVNGLWHGTVVYPSVGACPGNVIISYEHGKVVRIGESFVCCCGSTMWRTSYNTCCGGFTATQADHIDTLVGVAPFSES